MSAIRLDDVSKVFDDGTVAVDQLTLEVAAGELMVLLGPSGCGKSTVLRMIAGLEEPTSGTVLLDGVDVDGIEPRDRNVSMVFQDYALYPHLTVRQNLGFPLLVRDTESDEIEQRVTAMAEHLGIAEVLDRRPEPLSGGQRQRVAMGRAIIRRPSVFLMDEPLSNVDQMLRARLRAEIADVVRGLGVTTVYVTHDQVEAMSMADRLAILRDGELQHVGTPGEIYHQPETTYVAAFLGSPRINLLHAYVFVHLDSHVALHLGRRGAGQVLGIPWADPRARTLSHYHGESIVLGIRADGLRPVDWAGGSGLAGQSLRGRVRYLEHLGHESIGYVDVGAEQVVVDGATELGLDDRPMVDVTVRLPAYSTLTSGEPVTLRVAPDELQFFERTGRRIHFQRI